MQAGRLYTPEHLSELLLRHDARHVGACPQGKQNYWRMRPEYRNESALVVTGAPYGPDRPCTCGLDDLIGKVDDRKQS